MARQWVPLLNMARSTGMPYEYLARLLLAGHIPFKVRKQSPGRDVVLLDIVVDRDAVTAWREQRWSADDHAKACGLVSRAALKFGLHPTRSSPGVRGKARKDG